MITVRKYFVVVCGFSSILLATIPWYADVGMESRPAIPAANDSYIKVRLGHLIWQADFGDDESLKDANEAISDLEVTIQATPVSARGPLKRVQDAQRAWYRFLNKRETRLSNREMQGLATELAVSEGAIYLGVKARWLEMAQSRLQERQQQEPNPANTIFHSAWKHFIESNESYLKAVGKSSTMSALTADLEAYLAPIQA